MFRLLSQWKEERQMQTTRLSCGCILAPNTVLDITKTWCHLRLLPTGSSLLLGAAASLEEGGTAQVWELEGYGTAWLEGPFNKEGLPARWGVGWTVPRSGSLL